MNHHSRKSSLSLKNRFKTTVMCVDDDPFNLEVLEAMLTDMGIRTVKARSGANAIELFTSLFKNGEVINLILMDCIMPEQDGWTTCKLIKNLMKMNGMQEIPIVGVSGQNLNKNEENYRNAQMDGLLQKPIHQETLENLLKDFIIQ